MTGHQQDCVCMNNRTDGEINDLKSYISPVKYTTPGTNYIDIACLIGQTSFGCRFSDVVILLGRSITGSQWFGYYLPIQPIKDKWYLAIVEFWHDRAMLQWDKVYDGSNWHQQAQISPNMNSWLAQLCDIMQQKCEQRRYRLSVGPQSFDVIVAWPCYITGSSFHSKLALWPPLFVAHSLSCWRATP